MAIAVLYNRKKVHWFEFMFGGFISAGMVLFAAADFTVYPDFNFIGESSNPNNPEQSEKFTIKSPRNSKINSKINSNLFFYWGGEFCFVLEGIILVSVSVLADAFLPNFQEKVFEAGSSRVEVSLQNDPQTDLTLTHPLLPFSFLDRY